MNKIKAYIAFFVILFFGIQAFSAEIYNDEIMDNLLKDVKTEKPVINDKYNYESTEVIPVKLRIAEKITTKKDNIYDNQEVVLYTRNPVKYKNKIILNSNEKFTANVAIYLKRGMNGIPAQIVLDNFRNPKIGNKKLSGVYIKRGFNFTPFVVPLKLALTVIPGVGTGLNFLRGGNVTITPNDTITIYYHPEWK